MKDKPENFLYVPNSGAFTGFRPGFSQKQSVQLSCFISRNIFTPPKPRLDLFGLIQKIEEQIDKNQTVKLLQVLEVVYHS